ncbi:hypothetical protein BD779DRAFT_1563582, partial [Infundibulicybe gibba]
MRGSWVSGSLSLALQRLQSVDHGKPRCRREYHALATTNSPQTSSVPTTPLIGSASFLTTQGLSATPRSLALIHTIISRRRKRCAIPAGSFSPCPVLIYCGDSIIHTRYVGTYRDAGSTRNFDVVCQYIEALAKGKSKDRGWIGYQSGGLGDWKDTLSFLRDETCGSYLPDAMFKSALYIQMHMRQFLIPLQSRRRRKILIQFPFLPLKDSCKQLPSTVPIALTELHRAWVVAIVFSITRYTLHALLAEGNHLEERPRRITS